MTNTITNVTICKASGYGNYVIKGIVNGQAVNASTFNSEAFDYLNSDDEEQHGDALLYCEMRLEQAFNRLQD
jgi:hypothetical protein